MITIIERRRSNPDVAVLRCAGALSLLSAARLRRALEEVLANRSGGVIVDLRGVVVSDPAFLVLLPTAAGRHPEGPPLAAVAAADDVTRWRHSGVLGVVTVHRSTDEAIAVVVRASAVTAHRRTLHLGPSVDACGTARTFVATACAEWHLERVGESAAVVAVELVREAVEHPQTSIELALVLRPPFLFINVEDHDADVLPAIPASSGPSRGSRVVDERTSGRGVIRRPGGKQVWASIRVVPIGPGEPASARA